MPDSPIDKTLSSDIEESTDKNLSESENDSLPSVCSPYSEDSCQKHRDTGSCLKEKCTHYFDDYADFYNEGPNLAEFHCLNRFYPILKVEIRDKARKRFAIAREIVAALHRKYPQFSQHIIGELLDQWNSQLSTKIRYLKNAVVQGLQEPSSCVSRLSIPQLEEYCDSSLCMVKDKSLGKTQDQIVERLKREVAEIKVKTGDGNGQANEYTFYLKERIMCMDDEELLKPDKFLLLYFRLFEEKLIIKHKQWTVFLNEIVPVKITERTPLDAVGSDIYIIERISAILNENEGGLVGVDDWTDWRPFNYYLDVRNRHVWVPAPIMEQILDRLNLKITLKKLASILAPVMNTKTFRKQVNGHRRRWWVLDAKKMDIDLPVDKLDTHLGEDKAEGIP